MSEYDLHLYIEYDIKTGKFVIKTDVKTARIPDIITETIMVYRQERFSSRKKEDDEKIDLFKIGVRIDLSCDRFNLKTNGSEEIILGILSHLLSVWGTDKVKVN